MSFQNCPNCGGMGINMNGGTASGIDPCPVCKGARIINSETGLPPIQTTKIEFTGIDYGPVIKEIERLSKPRGENE